MGCADGSCGLKKDCGCDQCKHGAQARVQAAMDGATNAQFSPGVNYFGYGGNSAETFGRYDAQDQEPTVLMPPSIVWKPKAPPPMSTDLGNFSPASAMDAGASFAPVTTPMTTPTSGFMARTTGDTASDTVHVIDTGLHEAGATLRAGLEADARVRTAQAQGISDADLQALKQQAAGATIVPITTDQQTRQEQEAQVQLGGNTTPGAAVPWTRTEKVGAFATGATLLTGLAAAAYRIWGK